MNRIILPPGPGNYWHGQGISDTDPSGHRDSDVTPSNGMQVTWTATQANWYYILIAGPVGNDYQQIGTNSR